MALMNDGVEKEVQLSSQWAKAAFESVANFFKGLIEYLERKNKFSAQMELAKHIKNNGSTLIFNPHQNRAEIKFMMERERVAYMEMRDGNIIIPEYEKDRVSEICRKAYVASNCYYQEVSRMELEDAVARMYRDREVLTLHNLDPYLAEVLKNKCNDISNGFMVGTEPEDNNKVSITVLDSNVYTEEKRKDFCKAYLEALTSYYGPNHERKIMQIEADFEFDKSLAEQLDTSITKYVVGVDEENVKNVIEISNGDFRHFQFMVQEDGSIVNELVTRVDKDDISYEEELQRVLDKIQNKSLVTDPNLVNEHLATLERNIDTLRPEKSEEEYMLSVAFARLNDSIDDEVHKVLSETMEEGSSPIEYFNAYRQDVNLIYSAILNDTPLMDYDKSFIDNLKQSFNEDIKDMLLSLDSMGIEKTKSTKEILDSFKTISQKLSRTRAEQHTPQIHEKQTIKEAIKNNSIDHAKKGTDRF